MALSTLYSVIRNAFEGYSYYNRYRPREYEYSVKQAFMIVPMFTKKFEVPSFLLGKFKDYCQSATPDKHLLNAFCAKLDYEGRYSSYASTDSKLRDSLTSSFENFRLIKVPSKNNTIYYVSTGAIFNQNLKPLAMMSWSIEKIDTEDSTPKFRIDRPILRVDPEVYTSKADDVQRWIVNKLIGESLSFDYIRDYSFDGIELFDSTEFVPSPIKVILDKIPFTIHTTDSPSVSTTNKDLLNVAIENIDEVLQ